MNERRAYTKALVFENTKKRVAVGKRWEGRKEIALAFCHMIAVTASEGDEFRQAQAVLVHGGTVECLDPEARERIECAGGERLRVEVMPMIGEINFRANIGDLGTGGEGEEILQSVRRYVFKRGARDQCCVRREW